MHALSAQRRNQLEQLLKSLKIESMCMELFDQSLTHSSYLNERGMEAWQGNERLEFLGDAVVGLVVTERLYERYASWPEGTLSKIRSIVVSRRILGERAREMGLGEYLLLGVGESRSGGGRRLSILAACFESVVGALYLGEGLEPSRQFILAQLDEEIERAVAGDSVRDHKSQLQEIITRTVNQVPRYRIVGTSGPDHDKTFEVEVILRGRFLGRGQGSSKKNAEQSAAAAAIACLQSVALRDILDGECEAEQDFSVDNPDNHASDSDDLDTQPEEGN